MYCHVATLSSMSHHYWVMQTMHKAGLWMQHKSDRMDRCWANYRLKYYLHGLCWYTKSVSCWFFSLTSLSLWPLADLQQSQRWESQQAQPCIRVGSQNSGLHTTWLQSLLPFYVHTDISTSASSKSGSRFTARTSFTRMSECSWSLVQGQLNVCLPTISRKIESRECFAKK